MRSADSAEAEARFNDAASSSVATDDPETLVSLATAVAAPTESDAPILDFTADYLTPASTNDALADTVGTAKEQGQADALDRLRDIRRCFVQRKQPVEV